MNFELVKKAFNEFESVEGIDYAIVDVDSYGDCNTCVNATLVDEFGETSKGIYLKYWTTGMNESDVDIEDIDKLYIAHDITEKQGKELYDIFSKYFKVSPKDYCFSKCYIIEPKK